MSPNDALTPRPQTKTSRPARKQVSSSVSRSPAAETPCIANASTTGRAPATLRAHPHSRSACRPRALTPARPQHLPDVPRKVAEARHFRDGEHLRQRRCRPGLFGGRVPELCGACRHLDRSRYLVLCVRPLGRVVSQLTDGDYCSATNRLPRTEARRTLVEGTVFRRALVR